MRGGRHVERGFLMRTPSFLRGQAQRCRRLASQITNDHTAEHLLALAAEYEAEALEHSHDGQMQAGDDTDDDGQQNQQQG